MTSNPPEATAQSFLDWAGGALREAGVASPEQDAWWILTHLLGVSKGHLHAQMIRGDLRLNDEVLRDGVAMVERRQRREPLWHITGSAPFLHFELSVGPGVFIPRPETELLAERAIHEALALVPRSDTLVVWDACAGSGALGLSLAHAIPHANVILIESSLGALPYLAANVKRYGLGRVDIVPESVAEVSRTVPAQSVDLVVSNPPYLVEGVDLLDVETSMFDPPEALFGGEDGLAIIREVIEASARVLRPGGVLIMEHGLDQHEVIGGVLRASGFTGVSHEADLVGRVRFTSARRA